MDDEGEVRLVVAHSERTGGHHRFELIGRQFGLDALAFSIFGAACIGSHRMAPAGEKCGGVLRPGHGQRVNDPRARGLA